MIPKQVEAKTRVLNWKKSYVKTLCSRCIDTKNIHQDPRQSNRLLVRLGCSLYIVFTVASDASDSSL